MFGLRRPALTRPDRYKLVILVDNEIEDTQKQLAVLTDPDQTRMLRDYISAMHGIRNKLSK